MRIACSLILLVPVLASAEPVRTVELDPNNMIEVPTGTNRVTTLSFPGAITAIDAANVTTDPAADAAFHLTYTKGASFLSVRALQAGASANLNVRWNGRTYVFLLVESPRPVLVLNMEGPARMEGRPAGAPRLSPAQLIALLDRARAFPILKSQQPEVVDGVELRSLTNNVTTFDGFEIRIHEIYRFDVEDTLVFRIEIRNLSDEVLVYRPDSFQVRAGRRLYFQSVSDASGEVPPHASAIVHFAITGTPEGGRADLSIENDFHVLVDHQ